MDPKDLPDFLSDEPSSAAPAEAQAPASPAAEAQPAADTAPAAEPAAPAPPAPPEVHHVPLATFLDTRDRLSAAEKEAKELREWRQQQEAASRRTPPPSRDEDPEGYQAHREAQFEAALYSQSLNTSIRLATLEHGKDVTDAALKWGLERCDADPFFNEKVKRSPDQMAVVIAEWRRDQIASKVDPTDFEAFQAWKAAQAAGAQAPAGHQPQPAAASAARPAAPRPSIAAAPSAGSHAAPVPRNGEATFDAMFGS